MRSLKSCLRRNECLFAYLGARDYSVRVRFAPSPTGVLHLGGLRTALYNFLFCKSQGGKFILRIEDTDQTRLVGGATDHLINILRWTGIEFDEGPHVGGSSGPYIQSERLHIYKEYCNQLLEQKHAYRCFCTEERLKLMRKQAALRREVPKYDNRCRHLNEDEVERRISENKPYVVRLKLASGPYPWHDLVYGSLQNNFGEGDAIIVKSDGYPTYHFANVIDDHLMDVTHVLRGVEWQISTPKHLMLYNALGWKPPKFAHLPLLLNKDGKKLSKRQNDVHVDKYKESGFFPEAVLNLVTNMGSGFNVQDTSGMNISQLVDEFNLSNLHTNSTRVDFDKIFQFNRLHLKTKLDGDDSKRTIYDRLRELVIERFRPHLLEPCQSLEELSDEYLEGVLRWSQNRISLLTDLLKQEYTYLWVVQNNERTNSSAGTDERTSSTTCHKERDGRLLTSVINNLSSLSLLPEDVHAIESISLMLKKVCDSDPSIKYGEYMRLIRQGLSGPKEGPSVAEMIAMLGKKKSISRLEVHLRSRIGVVASEPALECERS